jgi:N-acetylglucosamine kinase-like BadF-type ATPase
MNIPRLFIGIDAGGSHARLLAAASADGPRHAEEGAGANPNRAGRAEAAATLAGLIARALAAFPGHRLAGLCIGAAGLGRPAEQEAFREALTSAMDHPPPDACRILADADLVLHAAYGPTASGALVIAGTGSIVLGRTSAGNRVRAGGWGYLLGDEGGGYRIGLAGLRAVACAFDGGTPTALTDRLRDTLGLSDPEALIRMTYGGDRFIPSVAPLVLDAAGAGDAVCSCILSMQTDRLAAQAAGLFTRHADLDRRIALWGGLIEHAGYARILTGAIESAVGRLGLVRLTMSPVEAALQLAMLPGIGA